MEGERGRNGVDMEDEVGLGGEVENKKNRTETRKLRGEGVGRGWKIVFELMFGGSAQGGGGKVAWGTLEVVTIMG